MLDLVLGLLTRTRGQFSAGHSENAGFGGQTGKGVAVLFGKGAGERGKRDRDKEGASRGL